MSLTDRLLSRKFWLAVGSVVWLGFQHAYGEVAQIVIAYMAVQAGVDALSQYQAARSTPPAPDVPEGSDPSPDVEGGQAWTGSTF